MKHRLAEPGFTLVELLVAMAITLLLSALLLSLVTSTLGLWRRTQDTFLAEAQAKFALDYLERDLQAAIFRRSDQSWLAVDIAATSEELSDHGWLMASGMKPSGAPSERYRSIAADGLARTIADARFGQSGTWLRFITSNVESAGSLPVAVSYQIARRPLTGPVVAASMSAVRYTLFRSAVTSGAAGSGTGTFGIGYAMEAAGYNAPIPSTQISSPLYQRHPSTVMTPHATDFIATNVVDFGVWFYRWDEQGVLTRIFPSSDTGGAKHRANALERFPEVVDVMVRVLTEEGARLIERIENGNGVLRRPTDMASDAEWWWSVVEANSRVVVRRIEVKGVSW